MNQKDINDIKEFQETANLFAKQLMGLSEKIQERLKKEDIQNLDIDKAQEEAKIKSEILTAEILSLQNKIKSL